MASVKMNADNVGSNESYALFRKTNSGKMLPVESNMNGAKAYRIFEEQNNDILRSDSRDELVVFYKCNWQGWDIEVCGTTLKEVQDNYLAAQQSLEPILDSEEIM